MTWKFKIGKKDKLYSVFEYFEDVEKDGDKGWTEEPMLTDWFETKKELIEYLELMLKDLKADKSHFDYE